MDKTEISKIIVFTFLNHHQKWMTAHRLSKASNLDKATVNQFLLNSGLVVKAKTKDNRGQALYALGEEAKHIYQFKKIDIAVIFSKIKVLLSEGKLIPTIDEFFRILKNEDAIIPDLLIAMFKEKLSALSLQLFHLEKDWESKTINAEKRYCKFDEITYSLYELIIELELILEELYHYKYKFKNVAIKINQDFATFNNKDSAKIVNEIAHLLYVEGSKINVRSIEKGSVVMTLEFEDSRQAEKLFLLIKLGELKQQGIFDARLKELIQGDKQNRTGEKMNTGILQFCKDLKNLIKLGKIEEAIEQMFDNDALVNDEYQNAIILYNSDLTVINKNLQLGIEDPEKIKIQRSKITYAVLNLIDKIAKSASHLSGGLETRFI